MQNWPEWKCFAAYTGSGSHISSLPFPASTALHLYFRFTHYNCVQWLLLYSGNVLPQLSPTTLSLYWTLTMMQVPQPAWLNTDPAVKRVRQYSHRNFFFNPSLICLPSSLYSPLSMSVGISCIFYICSNFWIEQSQGGREIEWGEKKERKWERRVVGELVFLPASCC